MRLKGTGTILCQYFLKYCQNCLERKRIFSTFVSEAMNVMKCAQKRRA